MSEISFDVRKFKAFFVFSTVAVHFADGSKLLIIILIFTSNKC